MKGKEIQNCLSLHRIPKGKVKGPFIKMFLIMLMAPFWKKMKMNDFVVIFLFIFHFIFIVKGVLVLPLFVFWMFFDGFHNEAKKDVRSWFAYLVRKVGEYRLVSGLLAVMVLSFIYFYWINKQSEGKFFEVFFGYHHRVRAMGNGALR